MERKLVAAASSGKEEEVRKILKENKEINVNWKESAWGYTALHWACARGHDKIVTLLLAHSDIDANQKTDGESTPFLYACLNGRTSCIQLLLKDVRVTTINEPDNYRHTPLYFAAGSGHLEVIK
jgi:ankyrin repeat protein